MSAPRRALVLTPALLLLVACARAGPAAPAPSVAVPTSSVVASPTAAPAPKRTVVLDPGHNGGNGSARAAITRQVPDGRGGTKACNTTGTSTDAGYPEHAFTWDLAGRVRAHLEAAGIAVVLTRTSDDGVGPCVDERGKAGQQAGADLLVSLHADGAAAAGHGFHVAYSSPPLNAAQSGPAVDLARDLRDALRGGGFPTSTYVGREGLSPRPDLGGLNFATVPAALVECANMRNAEEAAVVSSAEGRERYAAAIATGIRNFLGALPS
ncbi:N-acetylmuramoyl-L-alanine amidase [Pseudonocardia sp. RS11V-5]|uniref:N-acetylmuramoyl-L-alanine amidase n=1 Tax=Pseudonocardia terrae TaxID=2905831 RepID=UPI001E47EDB3|nr:N-acetylmuramoyl-L-alanine amidase [Pseudonocardia terrae]MCE3550493.1 N-acetylmuramoyl-L-alanine amidase [Pseudonocardia terrae]